MEAELSIQAQNPLEFLLELAQRSDKVCNYETAFGPVYFCSHPDHVKEVLLRPNFRRTALVKQALGEGLLSSDGPHWQRQRRLMQPHFTQAAVSDFAPVIQATTAAAILRWEEHALQRRPIDLSAELTRLTLEIVVNALFSVELAEEVESLNSAITAIMEHLGHIAHAIFSQPAAVSPARSQQFSAALETIDRYVGRIIQERRRKRYLPADLLSLLIKAQEQGSGLSDRHLRDEVVTMLISGHETTSLILSWAWYLLAGHPAVESRLCIELDGVLGGRPPTVADLPELPFTRMVLEEAMRLYPPVWYIARQAVTDDEIAGVPIPADAVVTISPYVLHRLPRYWEDPERFDPERFLVEPSTRRPRYAYLPFGGGRHTCLGNHFAMMEGVFVLAKVTQRFRVRLVPGHPIEPYPMLTLRQRYGIQAILERREDRQGHPSSDRSKMGLEI